VIFYLIPKTVNKPSQVELTQDLARAECRERGLKPSAFEQYVVPTDKAGLQKYVNEMLAAVDKVIPSKPAPDPIDDPDHDAPIPAEDEVDLDQHTGRNEIAQDGHPNGPPGYTSTQIAAGVMPKTQKLRDVCYIVSKMTASELGTVALEVIARGAKLGGVA